jgi:hypothetical protein
VARLLHDHLIAGAKQPREAGPQVGEQLRRAGAERDGPAAAARGAAAHERLHGRVRRLHLGGRPVGDFVAGAQLRAVEQQVVAHRVGDALGDLLAAGRGGGAGRPTVARAACAAARVCRPRPRPRPRLRPSRSKNPWRTLQCTWLPPAFSMKAGAEGSEK